MKLYYSNTSPYSRKVRIVMLEKKLETRIEGVLVNPFVNDASLSKVNPLGKIPALVLDNGLTLFDSPVIGHYLDSLSGGLSLIPSDESKWQVLKWEALADGILDAAYNLVIEIRRTDAKPSAKWTEIWTEDIKRAVDELENNIETLGDQVQLSHIAIATAMGYLAFRQPGLFPAEDSKVAKWFNKFKQRPSMLLTAPIE